MRTRIVVENHQPKPRFVILDALRGAAGISVVLLHLSEAYFHDRVGTDVKLPILVSHGYLAVEFFILLMGYMLGFAYDRRWEKGMSLKEFFAKRLVRLHPLVISGVLIGLAVWFWNPSAGYWPAKGFDKVSSLGACGYALWAMTMVPVLGFGHLNPFNACSWTLYYEYIGNFLYATFVRRLPMKVLFALAAVSFYFLFCLIFKIDAVAWLGIESEFFHRSTQKWCYSLVGGTDIDSATQVYRGFMRLFFAFFLGLILSRSGWRIRLRRFPLAISLAVFTMVMFMPFGYGRGLDDLGWLNGVFELFALAVIFPVLILIGVGSETQGERTAAVSKFLGELSYPLYMTHFPLYYIFAWWVYEHSGACSLLTNVLVSVSTFAALVFASWLVMEGWDKPIQRRLMAMLKKDNR